MGMMINRRRVMGNKSITSLGYVTDGLIFMFDGIWNQGIGKHTDDPTMIKELIYGVPLLNDSSYPLDMTCLDDSLLCKNSNADGESAYADFNSTKYGDAVNEGTVTFEVCCVPSTETISTFGDQEWGISIHFDYYRRFLQDGSSLNVTCNGRLLYIPNSIVRYNVANFNKYNTIGRTFTQVAPSTKSSFSNCQVYTNGIREYNSTDYYVHGDIIQNKIRIGALKNKKNQRQRSHPFKVYSLRMYNRGLTQDEVIHNYNIDKLRFGID